MVGDRIKVDIRNLSVKFGSINAVNDISLVLDEGITFLLGRNGAGKTTFCKALAGALDSFDGEISFVSPVHIAGVDFATRGESIGWMPQEFSAPSHMRVFEYVEYAAWLKGVERGLIRTKSAAAIEAVGLAEKSKSSFRALSGGMKRRLALAGALVHEPRFLILDEPTAGLDPEQRQGFHDTIRAVVGASRSTVLISTHILEDVVALPGVIEVMDAGSIVTQNFKRPEVGDENSETLRLAFLAAIQQ